MTRVHAAALSFCLPLYAANAPSWAGAAPVPPHPRPSPTHSPARRPVDDSSRLFSLRARRRVAAYIRMRLLEMREEGLERAADAVERRMTADQLLDLPPAPR